MNINNATPAGSAGNPPATATSTGNNGANAKPAIGFLIRGSDAVLTVTLARIIESMTANAAYPNPAPTLAAITAARDTYVLAVNTLDRGSAAQIRRNDARAAVVKLIRSLALYVQQTCQGDLGVLVSSGFPVQKRRGQPVGELEAPVDLRLAQGTLTGQLRVKCKVVHAAKAYQWRFATAAAPTLWTLSDPVTSSRSVLEGLTACTTYIVQARAVGAQGASNWSEASTAIAM